MLALALGLAVSGCGDAGDTADDRPLVIATTTILGDVLREIVGDRANVEVLLPVGADPHDYQASAQQAATLHDAALVVANGLGLEEGLEDVLDAAESDGVPVLRIGEFLDPLPVAAGHSGEEEEPDEHDHEEEEEEPDEHDHEGDDPHVWMDPVRMANAVDVIAAELTRIDPDTDWAEPAAAYRQRLLDADEQIAAVLEPIPPEDRKLVTNHESLGYFARRYDLEVIGVVVPGGSTLADPSSAELAELIARIEAEQVTAIFAETIESSALAEAVASESGENVDVVELYTGSLGEPGSGADTLIDMLLTDARRIAAALGG